MIVRKHIVIEPAEATPEAFTGSVYATATLDYYHVLQHLDVLADALFDSDKEFIRGRVPTGIAKRW